MTTHPMRAVLTALMLLFASCGGGCAGQQAREHVLLPAMRQAWSGPYSLREMAERAAQAEGSTIADELAKADKALASGMPALIAAVAWPRIDDLIVADIVRRITVGEIPIGVGESARESLLQFQRGRAALLQEVAR